MAATTNVANDSGCGPMMTFDMFVFAAGCCMFLAAMLLFFTDTPSIREGRYGTPIVVVALALGACG